MHYKITHIENNNNVITIEPTEIQTESLFKASDIAKYISSLQPPIQTVVFDHHLPTLYDDLPITIENIVFQKFNQIITPKVIPLHIKTITFGDKFNQIIVPNSLPEQLLSLTFGSQYDQVISTNSLPDHLDTLVFGWDFNQVIESDVLPKYLKSLVFGFSFNHLIQPNTLPTHLTSLTLGDWFNQAILPDSLPESLTSLTFGSQFNQTIDHNTLPPNLKYLTLGSQFNRIIRKGTLPTSLESLKVHSKYKYFIHDSKLTLVGDLRLEPQGTIKLKDRVYHKLYTFVDDKVYLVGCEESNQLMVCKTIRYSTFSQNCYDRMWYEIGAMEILQGNRNFAQLISKFHDEHENTLYILIDYYSGQDLDQLIMDKVSKKTYFREEIIWKYISNLFLILELLENNGIVHCDIKPSNIFIGDDGRLILGDFGCCWIKPNCSDDDDISAYNNDSIRSSRGGFSIKDATVGTEGYLAPEVTTSLQYDTPIDIYSTGSTLVKLLSCHPDDVENFHIFKKDRNDINISKDRYSERLIDFVKLLVVAKREDRLSLQMILNNEGKKERHIHSLPTPIPNFTNFYITELILENYNHPISTLDLPISLKSLTLDSPFNSAINSGSLPHLLEKLTFGSTFNQPISTNVLPPNLKTLTFGVEFNQVIQPNVLPARLETLLFGEKYNQKVNINTLPLHLKTLTFGWRFNQMILPNTLPPNLERLTFGWDFNQFIKEKSLPKTLNYLELGYEFTREFEPNSLPMPIELKMSNRLKLKFKSYEFNKKITIL